MKLFVANVTTERNGNAYSKLVLWIIRKRVTGILRSETNIWVFYTNASETELVFNIDMNQQYIDCIHPTYQTDTKLKSDNINKTLYKTISKYAKLNFNKTKDSTILNSSTKSSNVSEIAF